MNRPADRALSLLALGLAACAACFLDAARLRAAGDDDVALRARLVGELRLTDLALFTEARYTRHPSQADLHSAFQDHPLALEHFPTGSLLGPPVALRETLGAATEARSGDADARPADGAKVSPGGNSGRPADGPQVSPGGNSGRPADGPQVSPGGNSGRPADGLKVSPGGTAPRAAERVR